MLLCHQLKKVKSTSLYDIVQLLHPHFRRKNKNPTKHKHSSECFVMVGNVNQNWSLLNQVYQLVFSSSLLRAMFL